jgi:hypothetical protein
MRALLFPALVVLAACPGPAVKKVFPLITVEPTTLDFGTQPSGNTTWKDITITNRGAAALKVSGGWVDGDARSAFQATVLPTTIPAGTSVTLAVGYAAPLLDGVDAAFLTLESNADNTPEVRIPLTGRVQQPCQPGQALCQGLCRDVAEDELNCGACGVTCSAPATCQGGVCACIPKTCGADACGVVPDGCGGVLTCGVCDGGLCMANRCLPATCGDALKNGDETDVDCGGPTCPACARTKLCQAGRDCESGDVCDQQVCSACREASQCASGQLCTQGRCVDCTTTAECGANAACVTGRCRRCPTEVAFNTCGICAGPMIQGIGASCSTADAGCPGVTTCTADGLGTSCEGPARNGCGVCGGPSVGPVGQPCQSAESCAGTTGVHRKRHCHYLRRSREERLRPLRRPTRSRARYGVHAPGRM